ncbi:MAG: FkbM family methyltransferase [Thermostichus sp. DRC_bins_24]
MSGRLASDWNELGLSESERASNALTAKERRSAWAAALYYWNQGLDTDPLHLPCLLNRLHALKVLGNSFSVMEEAGVLLTQMQANKESWQKLSPPNTPGWGLAWRPPQFPFVSRPLVLNPHLSPWEQYLHFLARWMAAHSGVSFRPESTPFWRLALTIDPEDIEAQVIIGLYLAKQAQVEGAFLLHKIQKAVEDSHLHWAESCANLAKEHLTSVLNGKPPVLPGTQSHENQGIKALYEDDSIILISPSLNSISTQVILSSGHWFEPEIDFCRRYLRLGMSMLDIGASIGSYTILAAKQVGEEGSVFAFEPSITCASLLEKSIELNRMSGYVKAATKAVGSQTGKVYLILNEDDIFNRTVSDLYGVTSPTQQVDQVTLDEWWLSNQEPNIDLVKIDIGGDALTVLKGAQHLLSHTSPVLIMEANGGRGSLSEQASEYLRERGYSVFYYSYYLKELLPAQKFVESLSALNVIAVASERYQELVELGLLDPDIL